jgi:hypothetical protein
VWCGDSRCCAVQAAAWLRNPQHSERPSGQTAAGCCGRAGRAGAAGVWDRRQFPAHGSSCYCLHATWLAPRTARVCRGCRQPRVFSGRCTSAGLPTSSLVIAVTRPTAPRGQQPIVLLQAAVSPPKPAAQNPALPGVSGAATRRSRWWAARRGAWGTPLDAAASGRCSAKRPSSATWRVSFGGLYREVAQISHTHTHTHTHTRTHARTHARMHAHAHTCTRVHTHTHTLVHPSPNPPAPPQKASAAY